VSKGRRTQAMVVILDTTSSWRGPLAAFCPRAAAYLIRLPVLIKCLDGGKVEVML
jgi:hypothetical protein